MNHSEIIDVKHDYSYHSGDTLLTNNKELVDFFNEVDIIKMQFKKGSQFRNTKTNKEKLDYIVTSLNENMVFHISYITGGEPIHLHRAIKKDCPCAVCSYRRLSLNSVLKEVYEEKDELKRAFVLFQLGKFNESLSVYYNIYRNAVKEENNTASYRILLIMQWVAQHANYLTDEDQDKEKKLIQQIKSIDREKQFYTALNGNKLYKEIVLFLHGDTMIDHYKLEMKERVESIRQHYQSQLRASYSSNSNLQNLQNTFLNFEMFTIFNGMAYTRFKDFEGICDDFVEGIFLSCSMNEYQSSRIEYLDDFVLERLLYYGKADRMMTHFNRYLKRQMPYKSNTHDFQKKISNFLNSDRETVNEFSTSTFWESSHSFYKIFWNLLILLSIVEFDEAFVISSTKKIFKFLENLPKRETHQLNHLASLIHAKGKVLKNEILSTLFKFIIKHPSLHKEDIFEQFSSIEHYKFKSKMTNDEFDQLGGLLFVKCEKCGEFHKNALFYLYPVLPKKYQAISTQKVNDLLNANFDVDLYYLSVLGNIIDHKPHFQQYLNLFKPISKKEKPYSHYYGEVHFRHLNNLMNLVFKTGSVLPDEFISHFKGLTDYYDWIFDMENFDYNKFSPIWLIQYPTKYYLQKAFSIQMVREKVRVYLQYNNQPTLAYYFTQWVN